MIVRGRSSSFCVLLGNVLLLWGPPWVQRWHDALQLANPHIPGLSPTPVVSSVVGFHPVISQQRAAPTLALDARPAGGCSNAGAAVVDLILQGKETVQNITITSAKKRLYQRYLSELLENTNPEMAQPQAPAHLIQEHSPIRKCNLLALCEEATQ